MISTALASAKFVPDTVSLPPAVGSRGGEIPVMATGMYPKVAPPPDTWPPTVTVTVRPPPCPAEGVHTIRVADTTFTPVHVTAGAPNTPSPMLTTDSDDAVTIPKLSPAIVSPSVTCRFGCGFGDTDATVGPRYEKLAASVEDAAAVPTVIVTLNPVPSPFGIVQVTRVSLTRVGAEHADPAPDENVTPYHAFVHPTVLPPKLSPDSVKTPPVVGIGDDTAVRFGALYENVAVVVTTCVLTVTLTRYPAPYPAGRSHTTSVTDTTLITLHARGDTGPLVRDTVVAPAGSVPKLSP